MIGGGDSIREDCHFIDGHSLAERTKIIGGHLDIFCKSSSQFKSKTPDRKTDIFSSGSAHFAVFTPNIKIGNSLLPNRDILYGRPYGYHLTGDFMTWCVGQGDDRWRNLARNNLEVCPADPTCSHT